MRRHVEFGLVAELCVSCGDLRSLACIAQLSRSTSLAVNEGALSRCMQVNDGLVFEVLRLAASNFAEFARDVNTHREEAKEDDYDSDDDDQSTDSHEDEEPFAAVKLLSAMNLAPSMLGDSSRGQAFSYLRRHLDDRARSLLEQTLDLPQCTDFELRRTGFDAIFKKQQCSSRSQLSSRSSSSSLCCSSSLCSSLSPGSSSSSLLLDDDDIEDDGPIRVHSSSISPMTRTKPQEYVPRRCVDDYALKIRIMRSMLDRHSFEKIANQIFDVVKNYVLYDASQPKLSPTSLLAIARNTMSELVVSLPVCRASTMLLWDYSEACAYDTNAMAELVNSGHAQFLSPEQRATKIAQLATLHSSLSSSASSSSSSSSCGGGLSSNSRSAANDGAILTY